MRDRLVVANGASEVSPKHSFPVADVLFAERSIQAERVPGGGDVGRRCSFTEHLLDRIPGNQMDQEKDEADYQPDDGESVKHALEESSQFSVLGSRFSVVRRRSQAHQSAPLFTVSASACAVFSIRTRAMRWPSISSTV